jgi:hypothetical protein
MGANLIASTLWERMAEVVSIPGVYSQQNPEVQSFIAQR